MKGREKTMNKTAMIVAAAFAGIAMFAHADTKTTYRDAQGRIQGTKTTDRYGKTTYRDGMGRIQGTVK
jgi:preprotein translocase subunit SecG